MATEIIESAILPDSRYENDWLVNYKTRPFAKVHGLQTRFVLINEKSLTK